MHVEHKDIAGIHDKSYAWRAYFLAFRRISERIAAMKGSEILPFLSTRKPSLDNPYPNNIRPSYSPRPSASLYPSSGALCCPHA